MTVSTQDNQAKPTDKELNFRILEAKYEKQLAQERQARQDAESKFQEIQRLKSQEEEVDDEPYIDHKKLEKKLAKFGEQSNQRTQTEIQKAVQTAIAEERKENWIKNNPDFYDTLNHAQAFAEKNPMLAEIILKMPESFERQQLVYNNIKALGIDKPEEKHSSMQQKVDANRRGPSYQPSNVGTSPYSNQQDFSPQGQKEAYAKMQELKSRLRI